jgi:hypothetical protein
MTRLLTLVALAFAMAFAPTPGEAASKRIHVDCQGGAEDIHRQSSQP